MSINSSQSVSVFPDILAQWPWKATINPVSGLQSKAESTAWILSLDAFTPSMQQAFERTNNHLLSSLAYPKEDKDVFRVGCDLMNWFFLFNESIGMAAPHEAQEIANIVMDAIHNPDKPRTAEENAIGEATRQFWKLSSQHASTGARHRFIEAMDQFTAATAQQAQERSRYVIKNVDEYFLFRRNAIGAKPAFEVLDFALNLPDKVFEDPVIQRLSDVCVDLIIIIEDLYHVEQASDIKGPNNLVTILTDHENLDLPEAMQWIDKHASKLVRNFLDDFNRMPSFGEELKFDVACYVNGMANWVRALDRWKIENVLYKKYEDKLLEITKREFSRSMSKIDELAEE
ncbi:hypothetical protein C0993_009621 [Termitomyces sp. T159_Od127]|nr:hypothetical protein C0993_009621 [Termitomyces sp. T159_Od127]